MSLHKLQRNLIDALRQPTDFDEVEGAIQLTSEKALTIYHNNNILRLTRVLSDIYSVCERLVGAEFFSAMARYYIKEFPATNPLLDEYGASLAEFLQTFPHTQEIIYFADVARLEWAWHSLSLHPRSPVFDFAKFGEITADEQDKIIFLLPENSALLRSDFPILKIWEVNQPDFTGELAVDFTVGGDCLFVWNNASEEWRIEKTSPEEFNLLLFIKQQYSFETLCEVCEQQKIDLENLLPAFISRGWICGFRE